MFDAAELTTLLEGLVPNEQGRARTNCPMCPVRAATVDVRRSLSVDMNRGTGYCHRCGWRPKFPGYVLFDEETPKSFDEEEAEVYTFTLPEGLVPVVGEPQAQPARQYLKSRGVSRKTAEEAKIHYAAAGKYRGMVVVPFLDRPLPYLEEDPPAWAGWQARTVSGAKRYHTEKDPSVKMFNWTALTIQTDTPVMVVEGTFDALPYWPHAAACLGKPTDTHVDMLKRAKRPVVVVLDGDSWREGEALARILSWRGQCASSIRLAAKEDPNTADHARLWEQVLAVSTEAVERFRFEAAL